MKSEMQATLDPVYMFVKTHVRKDGKPINTDAQTRIAKMQDFLQNPSLTSDGPTSQMEAFTNIMGPERPDCVQGLRLGLTPTRYFGSSSSHLSSSSELTTLRKELHEAKTQLAETRATIDTTIDEKVSERTATIVAHMEERFEAKMQ
eukprot:TRINITY_DN2367_c0_g1_i2.p1 TRINITY_DN2367_c0_g1~~TRINITY_DN2367_c0_g1_i2.p1  ORF type:complete len:147 (+),score=14.76 TRINITY_DN2367_c0_g1_i2:151-591(+)